MGVAFTARLLRVIILHLVVAGYHYDLATTMILLSKLHQLQEAFKFLLQRVFVQRFWFGFQYTFNRTRCPSF